MLAAFCPEPPKHVGQLPVFNVEDETEDEEELADGEYMWDAGVDANTELRNSL